MVVLLYEGTDEGTDEKEGDMKKVNSFKFGWARGGGGNNNC